MTDSPEKQAAIARLLELEQDLVSAEKALKDWYAYDMNRRDGSTRQDNMHEEEGRNCNSAVWGAKNAVEAQKRLISDMD